jgi:predicted MFS family arabinose efflux permease
LIAGGKTADVVSAHATLDCGGVEPIQQGRHESSIGSGTRIAAVPIGSVRGAFLIGQEGVVLKFELQAILLIAGAVGGFAWLVTQNVMNKARERGLLDKAKTQIVSFGFWRNVFAAIGMIAVVLFIISLFSSPPIEP